MLRTLRNSARVSTPDEIYEAARRLAALLLICGKSAIHIGPIADASAEADLHLSQAVDSSGLEVSPLTEPFLITRFAVHFLHHAAPHRFGFAHQTFAECLAAQFLSRLHLVQIRKLLCARDAGEEYVIPQLAETAAWVAGIREGLFRLPVPD